MLEEILAIWDAKLRGQQERWTLFVATGEEGRSIKRKEAERAKIDVPLTV